MSVEKIISMPMLQMTSTDLEFGVNHLIVSTGQ